jgi:hypothetical protein
MVDKLLNAMVSYEESSFALLEKSTSKNIRDVSCRETNRFAFRYLLSNDGVIDASILTNFIAHQIGCAYAHQSAAYRKGLIAGIVASSLSLLIDSTSPKRIIGLKIECRGR